MPAGWPKTDLNELDFLIQNFERESLAVFSKYQPSSFDTIKRNMFAHIILDIKRLGRM